MRARDTNGYFSLQAIAGSHVVILGMNVDKDHIAGLKGFAIERTDHTEKNKYWLPNFKTFKGKPFEKDRRTYVNPIQEFVWGDYTAKQGHDYTYRVIPMYGLPGKLTEGPQVSLRISTENRSGSKHAVYFNRGAAASQAYARKFKNKKPSTVGKPAWAWLSRGLEEALLGFIGQAKNRNYGLRAAVYEFTYAPVLNAFRAASRRGADVQIVFDCKKSGKKETGGRNLAAIKRAQIQKLTTQRAKNRGYIAHNKFIVLLKNKRPAEVWTGSTNITDGGIFGQSNVGHIVRDARIAARYVAYWKTLAGDPDAKSLRKWNERDTPVPREMNRTPLLTPVFSPRGSLEALNSYARRMDRAGSSVFFTAAFGISQQLDKVLFKQKPYLRYILLERPDKEQVELTKRDPDNRFAVGSLIEQNILEKWLREKLSGLNRHVRFVHTKYMLLDPLSDDPTVITGSANFSKASTINNDENMLVIRGDKTVADIYLGEFMRLFNHYEFRQHLPRGKKRIAASSSHKTPKKFLDDTDEWVKRFYVKNSYKEKERLLFS